MNNAIMWVFMIIAAKVLLTSDKFESLIMSNNSNTKDSVAVIEETRKYKSISINKKNTELIIDNLLNEVKIDFDKDSVENNVVYSFEVNGKLFVLKILKNEVNIDRFELDGGKDGTK